MALGGGNTDKKLTLSLVVNGRDYIKDLINAINATDDFQKRVRLLEKLIPALAKANDKSWEEIARAIRKTTDELQIFSETTNKSATVALKNLQNEAAGVTEEVEETTGVFGRLGSLMQGLVGGVLGVSLIGTLRGIVNWFGEAIEAGREFGRSLFQLEVAVRGLRRVGIETNLQEFRDEITRLRSEFRLYTEKELTEAISGIALFTRDIGLNKEEIFELTEASAALAIVTGKDVGEQGFAIARAIASGYTEALQRAGIAISKTTIASKALELGINKGFMAMTEQERAAVTLALVMERLAPIQEDLAEFQENYTGRIEVAEQAQRSLSEQLGRRLIPINAQWQELLGRVAEGILNVDLAIRTLIIKGVPNLIAGSVGVVAALTAMANGAEISFRTVARSIVETRNQVQQELINLLGLGDPATLGAPPALGEPTFVAGEDERASTEENIQSDIEEELIKGQQRRFQLILDWQRRVSDLIRDFQSKREQLERQLQQRLEEITIRFTERRANLIEDYEIRRAAIIRQFQQRQDELNRRYRQKELDDEARFQEELRQLRENFILDLEDAVRERDARQIIRLTRQFNLRRQQMIRERELEKQENAREYRDRQKQIQDQLNERLRQLDIEHRARLARLDRQERLEREKQQRAHENRMQEEQIRFEERKAELDRRREEELQDLDRQIRNRLELQIKGWVEEGKITRDNVNAIFNTLSGTFGPGGRIEGLYVYTVSLIQAMGEAMSQLGGLTEGAFGQYEGGSGATPGETNAAQGFQEGGTVFASRPTVALFGEGGPEFATFTPVGRRGANAGRVFGNVPAGVGRPGMMGAIELAVLLSPDLEARIVNNTLDRTADVIFSLERSRR